MLRKNTSISAMENLLKSFLFVLVLTLVFGSHVHAVPYDYSFTHECLAKPLGPQYGGGIVVNSELNQGLEGWTTFGDAKIEHRQHDDGNSYIIASDRKQSFHSFAQKFNLEHDKFYTLSAWLQVSNGSAHIAAVFKTLTGYEKAGWVIAQKGCWSMLKGGLVVNASGPAELYFESHNPEIEIWADSISLQPFSHEEWESHQDQSIEKFRKRRVKVQAQDELGQPISNATVSLTQLQSGFPLGCAINQNILQNTAYQNWFTSRFRYTVFENELKWYSNEGSRGSETYSVSDAMIQFARAHGVAVRGHNVFWDDPSHQPSWIGSLSTDDLWAAAKKRINSSMGRYKGQLFHWDVVNENVHFSYFEDRLGFNASTFFYKVAQRVDPSATPFLNEYNTIEDGSDKAATPSKYLQRISQIRDQGYKGPLGIGLEGHFLFANLPYIRSALDSLASAGLPMWVTELDVFSGPNQGIIIWAAWSPGGCYRMCLTDNNFNNLETGALVDKFRAQLGQEGGIQGTTDSNGLFETSVFHGDYEATVSHPNGSKVQKFSVLPNEEERDVFQFKMI